MSSCDDLKNKWAVGPCSVRRVRRVCNVCSLLLVSARGSTYLELH